MYHMMQRRRNFGTILAVDEEEDEDLDVFLDKYDLQKSPQGESFADVPPNELLAPPSPSEYHRSPSPDEEETHADVQSDIEPSPEPPAAPAEVAPSIAEVSASLDGLANYSSSPLRQEREETPMEVDEKSQEVLSPSQSLHSKHGEEQESDDILVTEPAEGQPSRVHPSSLPRLHIVENDDDRDELDIISSLSPSHSTSETSVEPYTQTTTQEPSRTDSETIDITVDIVVSPRPPPRPPLTPDVAEHSDVDMAANEPDEKESVADEMSKEILDQASPEKETTPELTHPEEESHVVISSPSRILQQPLVRSVAVEVPHRQMPIYIPAPSSPIPGLPEYNFEVEPETEPEPMASQRPVSPKQQRHHFNPIYNLPPLKALPVEFNRKLKSTKGQRRREKEREKNERGSERGDSKRETKEDWVPMGINKWGATVRANPVYKKVSRATKCLSTRDWNVC
jgi:chromatin modification-related protein VID21